LTLIEPRQSGKMVAVLRLLLTVSDVVTKLALWPYVPGGLFRSLLENPE